MSQPLLPFQSCYDISVTLGAESAPYPGDCTYTRTTTSSIQDGDDANVSEWRICAHSGTHLDIPYHFIDGSPSVDQYPLERFILPARVVTIHDPDCIGLFELQRIEIEPGMALLFQTENSRSGLTVQTEFSERFVYLTPDAAQWCVDRRVSLVGIDYASVDPVDAGDYPSHHILLGHGIFILENLNLAHVPEGQYTLVALPLKIAGAEASPVRAVLLRSA